MSSSGSRSIRAPAATSAYTSGAMTSQWILFLADFGSGNRSEVIVDGPLSLRGQERRAELATIADELASLLQTFEHAAAHVSRPGDSGTVAR
jgi:hypothetical protein